MQTYCGPAARLLALKFVNREDPSSESELARDGDRFHQRLMRFDPERTA